MKIKPLKSASIFLWLALVFYWANYTNIPKGSFIYVLKTLPLIIFGIYVIEILSGYVKNK